MTNPSRINRAMTMYAKIYPYRDAIKQDCPPKIQLILMINKWINPWHALQDLAKEIPFKKRKALENYKDERTT